jgi:hypothetical protein
LRYAGAPERWLPIRYRAGEERNRINLSAILIHSSSSGSTDDPCHDGAEAPPADPTRDSSGSWFRVLASPAPERHGEIRHGTRVPSLSCRSGAADKPNPEPRAERSADGAAARHCTAHPPTHPLIPAHAGIYRLGQRTTMHAPSSRARRSAKAVRRRHGTPRRRDRRRSPADPTAGVSGRVIPALPTARMLLASWLERGDATRGVLLWEPGAVPAAASRSGCAGAGEEKPVPAGFALRCPGWLPQIPVRRH